MNSTAKASIEVLWPVIVAVLATSVLTGARAQADVPTPIVVPGEVRIALIHAQGAQIYECKVGEANRLTWQFREPVAALFESDRTVGRHYAGPSWELDDGSLVTAKVIGRAPGATAGDIPLLKLEIATSNRRGRLKDATTIQRLNTKGGVAAGNCEKAGDLLSVTYSADYAVLKRPD